MSTRNLNVQTPGAQTSAPAQPSSENPSSQPDGASDNEALVSGAADLDMPMQDNPAPAASDLPPDLQALVAREVAMALAKQAAASKPAAGKAGPVEVPYADAEKQLAAMTPEERRTTRPILTDRGWLVSPEYGAPAGKVSLA